MAPELIRTQFYDEKVDIWCARTPSSPPSIARQRLQAAWRRAAALRAAGNGRLCRTFTGPQRSGTGAGKGPARPIKCSRTFTGPGGCGLLARLREGRAVHADRGPQPWPAPTISSGPGPSVLRVTPAPCCGPASSRRPRPPPSARVGPVDR